MRGVYWDTSFSDVCLGFILHLIQRSLYMCPRSQVGGLQTSSLQGCASGAGSWSCNQWAHDQEIINCSARDRASVVLSTSSSHQYQWRLQVLRTMVLDGSLSLAPGLTSCRPPPGGMLCFPPRHPSLADPAAFGDKLFSLAVFFTSRIKYHTAVKPV